MTSHNLETMMFDNASSTATMFVARAVTELDALLGEGYAASNPTILCQWVAVASTVHLAQLQINAAGGLANQIERVSALADAIEGSAAAANAGKMQ